MRQKLPEVSWVVSKQFDLKSGADGKWAKTIGDVFIPSFIMSGIVNDEAACEINGCVLSRDFFRQDADSFGVDEVRAVAAKVCDSDGAVREEFLADEYGAYGIVISSISIDGKYSGRNVATSILSRMDLFVSAVEPNCCGVYLLAGSRKVYRIPRIVQQRVNYFKRFGFRQTEKGSDVMWWDFFRWDQRRIG